MRRQLRFSGFAREATLILADQLADRAARRHRRQAVFETQNLPQFLPPPSRIQARPARALSPPRLSRNRAETSETGISSPRRRIRPRATSPTRPPRPPVASPWHRPDPSRRQLICRSLVSCDDIGDMLSKAVGPVLRDDLNLSWCFRQELERAMVGIEEALVSRGSHQKVNAELIA